MKRPLAVIGFTCFLMLAVSSYFPPAEGLALGALLLAAFWFCLFWRKTRGMKAVLLSLFAAALCAFWYQGWYLLRAQPLRGYDGQTAQVQGVLLDVPQEEQGYYTFTLDVTSIGGRQAHTRLLAYAQNPPEGKPYDTLEGQASLRLPSGRQSYLAAKGVLLTAGVREDWRVTGKAGASPGRFFYQIRSAVEDKLRTYFPSDAFGLVKGVLFGDKSSLDSAVYEDFRMSGVAHMLAVSGLHLSILCACLLELWKLLRIPGRAACLVNAAFILCFMGVTGFTPSVTRAGIMLLCWYGGQLVKRESDSYNSLGLAVLLLLVFQPYSARDIGLQLSFAACMGILYLHPRLMSKWKGKGKWSTAAVSCLSVSLCATVFTMPFTLAAFGGFSLIAPVTNLALSLPVTILLSGLLLFAALPFFSSFLAAGLTLLVRGMVWVANALAGLPGSYAYVSQQTAWLWLAATGALALAVLWLGVSRRKTALAAVFSCAVLAVLLAADGLSLNSGPRLLLFADNYGMSVVVADGGKAAVIGAGGKSGTASRAREAVKQRYAGSPSAVFFPSLNRCFAGGGASLLQGVRARTVVMPDTGPYFTAVTPFVPDGSYTAFGSGEYRLSEEITLLTGTQDGVPYVCVRCPGGDVVVSEKPVAFVRDGLAVTYENKAARVSHGENSRTGAALEVDLHTFAIKEG